VKFSVSQDGTRVKLLVLRLLSVTYELLGLGVWNLVRWYSVNIQLIYETFFKL